MGPNQDLWPPLIIFLVHPVYFVCIINEPLLVVKRISAHGPNLVDGTKNTKEIIR